ncbi:helix-turn-helix protein [Tamaricihabitans halophyticus]|uniref:Helix-turn-helix protein n=2 Tax=Tamaricihabitans halophyticus TaxID=1262583 RepID=A0A4V2SSL9_9PSEU|nr:helix-turn-helix protein [Tamaricihabitans halophyticus]
MDVVTYQRILGEEIRKLRKRRGWTRKELNQHLQSDISLQTLATYELGTRQCSVTRLVEICLALDELPHDLLARVHERMFSDSPVDRVRLDLTIIVQDQQPELWPLHRWAKGRLAQVDPVRGDTEVLLDIAALENLAQLCGLETVQLIAKLRNLATPAAAHAAND